MSVRPGDITALIALIEIATKAAASIKKIRAENPEVYAEVGKHHADALARLEAEVAFTLLAERLPNLRPSGPGRRRPGTTIRGFRTLPVTAERAAHGGGAEEAFPRRSS